MKALTILTLLLCVFKFIQCANILAIVPCMNKNYRTIFKPLWPNLADRGHKIVILTGTPLEAHENITQIDVSKDYRFEEDEQDTPYLYDDGEYETMLARNYWVRQRLNDSYAQKLKDVEFDLVFLELSVPFWATIAALYNAPLIGLNSRDAVNPSLHAYQGNPIHPAIYPKSSRYLGTLDFLDRAISAVETSFSLFWESLFAYSVKKAVKETYAPHLPNHVHVLRSMSLMFINANPVFYPSRPLVPTTVNLGGFMQITEPEPLPEDLQEFLDDSVDGCIYVSFGTTVNSEYLSREQKNVLVNVFKAMAPMRILWKFDDVKVASGAKNIEVRTWVPQQDILRHPNVKLFITQGGLQSMEEAIDSAVPMLGMPFYGDQLNNVNKMEYKKFGLKLNPKDMNEQSLKKALEELLDNKTYKQTIEKLSAIARDQPMNGLEKAVWWTEYVLRHKGTQHLRSPSADIPLYQYYFIDVILTIAVFLFLSYKLLATLHKYTFKIVSDAFYAIKPPKTKKE